MLSSWIPGVWQQLCNNAEQCFLVVAYTYLALDVSLQPRSATAKGQKNRESENLFVLDVGTILLIEGKLVD